MKLIMIGGPARSGKNSFAEALASKLAENNKTVALLSFAEELKQDCAFEIQSRFGLDSFSEVTDEKNTFRPVLINRARENRAKSENAYYTDIMRNKLKGINSDFSIITDLRHNESEKDEVSLRNDYETVIVYVKPKWDLVINDEEKRTLPKVEAIADWVVEWGKCSKEQNFDLFLEPFIESFTRHFSNVRLFL